MKYRTKSADVLNEADRFQTILDWRIFKEDQEALLWNRNSKPYWIPGDPIYKDPRSMLGHFFNMGDSVIVGYEGHHVRPMFQLVDEETMHMMCKDCNVSWGGEEECWNCGKIYKRPGLNSFYSASVDSPQIASFLFDEPNFASIIREGLQIELGREWARLMNEAMTNFSIGMREVSDSMRGWSIGRIELDDQLSFYGGAPDFTPEDEVLWRNANVFAVTEVPVELVRPVAADLTPVREMVEIPADVDLSGRVVPVSPQMPEPRDWSEWTYEPTYGPPTTPTNRRRDL